MRSRQKSDVPTTLRRTCQDAAVDVSSRASSDDGAAQQSEIDRERAVTGARWSLAEASSTVLRRCNAALCDSNDRLTTSIVRIAESRRRILSSRLRGAPSAVRTASKDRP
jgi:hypothetical protein